MDIYNEKSYKHVIKKRSMELKRVDSSAFSLGSVAKAARMQQPFLSRVFRDDKAHFTSDQLFHTLKFLKFKPEEEKYIFLLYEFERSGSADRKRALQNDLDRIRTKKLTTAGGTNIKETKLSTEQESLYFLDPETQAAHVLLSIEKHSKNPDHVRELLGLKRKRFAAMIESLSELGILEVNADRSVKVIRNDLHLSSKSALFPAYRKLSRMFANNQLSKISDSDGYSLSVMVSVDAEVRMQIQKKLLDLLNEIRELVKKCDKPDEAIQMVFDLIPLTSI